MHDEPGLHARQLAQMLRRCREDAGMSTYALADLSYISQTRITRIENEKLTPTTMDVDALALALGVAPEVRSALMILAQRAIPGHRSSRHLSLQGWSHRMNALTHLVRSSDRVRYFLPAMLVGLLQTYEYAHASVYSPVPFSGDQSGVAATKVARQILLDDETIQFTFLLTRAAVEWKLVPEAQMRRQWARLVEVSRKPNVTLRVLGDGVVGEGPLNTFILYDSRLLTAELFSGEVTLADSVDIAFHERLFDYFLSVAMSEDETREWIQQLI